jgi:ribose transport system permease protein
VLLLGCLFHGNGAFFEWQTHRALLREIAVVGTLACGMTVVIVCGGIDLAVGSVLAGSAVSFALLVLPLGVPARGGIGLTLVGTLTLGYLQKVLSLNAYSTEARLMLTGAILIFAVLFQRRLGRTAPG